MHAADLASLVARSYTSATWYANELSALYTVQNGARVIAIPGTKAEIGEWLRDLDVMPIWDRDIGICHRGFRDGTLELYRASPLSDHDFAGAIICGHSLGGALAILLGAFLTAWGMPPAQIVTFGAPRCGSWRVRRVLAKTPLRLYRNGDDPVPEVPWLPGLYLHPRALIAIGEPALDPIADHHVEAYERALEGVK